MQIMAFNNFLDMFRKIREFIVVVVWDADITNKKLNQKYRLVIINMCNMVKNNDYF